MRKNFAALASNEYINAASFNGNEPLKFEAGKRKISTEQFLKTNEELDVDIYKIAELETCMSIYLKIIENKDGYINISIPVRIDSGYMEENY